MSKSMRVLHITSNIYINSGVMSVIMNYYRNIDHSKLQFDFLYFTNVKQDYQTYEKEIHSLGGNIFSILNFKNIILFNRKLNILLKKEHYDAIHLHDPFIIKFIYRTLRMNNIKIFLHSHATKWSDKMLSAIRNRILCYNLSKYSDGLLGCSHEAGKFMFGKDSNFIVMNNAIDTKRYKFNNDMRIKIRQQLKLENNTIYGHVGNFTIQKNHQFLIKVFQQIALSDDTAVLLLIGSGPLLEESKYMVEKLGLNNKVFFLGRRIDVENYYQAMDCFILPSLFEGLPMVGVEAQCSGLPILFADTITKEVGLVEYAFLSLNQSFDIWADKAIYMARRSINREIAKDKLIEKGFDVCIEANKLYSIYAKEIV